MNTMAPAGGEGTAALQVVSAGSSAASWGLHQRISDRHLLGDVVWLCVGKRAGKPLTLMDCQAL